MADEALHALRCQIDKVDEEVIACLAKRIDLSTQIAAHKRVIASSVVQRDRANQVEENYVKLGEALGLCPEFMREMYRVVHAESCRVQQEVMGS